MLKLKLDNITKTYRSGETVTALKRISLGFRKNEFISILGPSGCGKTTMLNIIGGLDQYDSGDLVINGLSTKKYKGSDWDAYRNRSIGFVFQSYNLIGHQSVLQNVEIALTLSGVSPSERKKRAKQALIEVGLEKHLKKKPNQLSGGQMQRVAIARALVNDPDIILADEPTGALDSHTSVQIMEILKEIAKTRLVIMVTHNAELADEYSTRIIKLLDGEIQSDSNPVDKSETMLVATEEKKKLKKTSMSLWTATSLSFKNLLTKKGRTITTSFAGSIGIIGVALVLALSSGLSAYMSSMQTDTLSGFPVTIGTTEQSFDMSGRNPMMGNQNATQSYKEFPDSDEIYRYDSEANTTTHTNILDEGYITYIEGIQDELPNAVNTISYQSGVNMNLLAKGGDTVVAYDTGRQGSMGAMAGMAGMGRNSYWQEMPENKDFILSLYDLVGEKSSLPAAANEVAIVVDEYNRINNGFFEKLGIKEKDTYNVSDFVGKTLLKVVYNDDYYTDQNGIYTPASASDYETLYHSDNSVALTVVGILRIKEDAASSYFSEGLVYTSDLTDLVVKNAKNSKIALSQIDSDNDVLTGAMFADDEAKEASLLSLGADTTPTGINIYPVDFEAKEKIKEYLDDYNVDKADEDQVIYSDMAETISDITGTLLDTVSYVLIGFAAISLLVSTIMIGIITYVSVIERTKEIGILRSVGARKKDISRVFNAETLIVGFTAGTIGVVLSYLISIPINAVIERLVNIEGIAVLSPVHAIILIAGSMLLTLIAGFFPSRMAAKKDPVVALRTE
ncbi:MAG: putative transporter ATP-binding/permease protein [Herbinix sp.]|jgi:putative ABC transport system permease protein|nr:putative transporter ATP-binding/permease protein [Herbinix sp.]